MERKAGLGGGAQNGFVSKQGWCAVGLSGRRTKGSGVEGCRTGVIGPETVATRETDSPL